MLVLTRKVDEVIVVDDVISVRVLKIQGGRVRLGIEAPDYLSIHRQEVLHKKAAQQSTFNKCLSLDVES